MRRIALLSAVVSTMLVAMLAGTPAEASINRTWVSSTGGGVACTRVAPCGDFQAAVNATNDGGEVNCVDPGDFTPGAVIITRSITIDCGGTFGAFSINTLEVNGAGIVVRLRNVSFQGTGSGLTAIGFLNGAALYVENCTISGYLGSGFGKGIVFSPQNGVTAALYVTDSIINNNGAGGSGGGIGIQPSGSGSARVMIERTRVEGNAYGIYAIGGTGGLILVHVRDSVIANSVINGIAAYTAGSTISITLDHSSSLLNGSDGILASGSNAYVVLANSTVMSNVTGLSSNSGGTILSYQDNHLAGNATDGAPTGMLSVK